MFPFKDSDGRAKAGETLRGGFGAMKRKSTIPKELRNALDKTCSAVDSFTEILHNSSHFLQHSISTFTNWKNEKLRWS